MRSKKETAEGKIEPVSSPGGTRRVGGGSITTSQASIGSQGSLGRADGSIGDARDLIRTTTTSTINSTGRGNSNTSNLYNSGERKKSVRFRDEITSEYGGSESDVESVSTSSKGGLVDVAYYGTLMQTKQPWADPNYFAGFTEVYTADELWISDSSCLSCCINSTYDIRCKDGKLLFYVEKHQDTWMTWVKSLCCRPCSRVRNGFNIKLYSIGHSLLVTFFRRSHFCADQRDIVEVFYGRNESQSYVGRIEKTQQGYLLRDKLQIDIYRVLRGKGSRLVKEESSWLSDNSSDMSIFRTDTKEIVGRCIFVEKGRLLQLISCCFDQPKVGFLCNSDVGTNAKILLLGVLFTQMHSRDKYEDLPLGNDAVNRDVLPLLPDPANNDSELSINNPVS